MKTAPLFITFSIFIFLFACSEENFKGSSKTIEPKPPQPTPTADALRDKKHALDKEGLKPIPVDCTDTSSGESQVTFKSVPTQTTWGHDGSKSGRRAYSPQGAIIRDLLNTQCNAGISTGFQAGMVSADKETRDAVCQLYGYLRATDNFTSWEYASPRDNSIAYFQGKTIVTSPNARTYNNGHMLGAVECIGKVAPHCNNQIINAQNIVCQ